MITLTVSAIFRRDLLPPRSRAFSSCFGLRAISFYKFFAVFCWLSFFRSAAYFRASRTRLTARYLTALERVLPPPPRPKFRSIPFFDRALADASLARSICCSAPRLSIGRRHPCIRLLWFRAGCAWISSWSYRSDLNPGSEQKDDDKRQQESCHRARYKPHAAKVTFLMVRAFWFRLHFKPSIPLSVFRRSRPRVCMLSGSGRDSAARPSAGNDQTRPMLLISHNDSRVFGRPNNATAADLFFPSKLNNGSGALREPLL
jgi:hypothetical protein